MAINKSATSVKCRSRLHQNFRNCARMLSVLSEVFFNQAALGIESEQINENQIPGPNRRTALRQVNSVGSRLRSRMRVRMSVSFSRSSRDRVRHVSIIRALASMDKPHCTSPSKNRSFQHEVSNAVCKSQKYKSSCLSG